MREKRRSFAPAASARRRVREEIRQLVEHDDPRARRRRPASGLERELQGRDPVVEREARGAEASLPRERVAEAAESCPAAFLQRLVV